MVQIRLCSNFRKEKLDLYYQERKKISEMYNSDKYPIEFKLEPKDLMMMDNHRLLRERKHETKEGRDFYKVVTLIMIVPRENLAI